MLPTVTTDVALIVALPPSFLLPLTVVTVEHIQFAESFKLDMAVHITFESAAMFATPLKFIL
jgi:hypothetical protein